VKFFVLFGNSAIKGIALPFFLFLRAMAEAPFDKFCFKYLSRRAKAPAGHFTT
jgi:hypothetical protein